MLKYQKLAGRLKHMISVQPDSKSKAGPVYALKKYIQKGGIMEDGRAEMLISGSVRALKVVIPVDLSKNTAFYGVI